MTLTFDKPAGLLEGGPRDGWAYFIEDLEHALRIAERTGTIFPYRATDRYEVHPRTAGKISSQVWEYVEKVDRRAVSPIHERSPRGALSDVTRTPAVDTDTSVHSILKKSTPHGVPPEGDSYSRRVYDAVLATGPLGASVRELAKATGLPSPQIGPIIGALLVGDALVYDVTTDLYVAASVAECDPWAEL